MGASRVRADGAHVSLNRVSMRVSLVVTVLTIGFFGLAVTLLTANSYRQQAVEERRTALAEDLRQALERIGQERLSEAGAIQLVLLADPGWESAWRGTRPVELAGRIDRLVRRYRDTRPDTRVQHVNVLDEHLEAMASIPVANTAGQAPGPTRCVTQARTAHDTRSSPLKIVTGHCLVDGLVVYGVYLPFTVAGKPGTLEVVSEWLGGHRSIEQSLAGPLRLSRQDGSALYQSPGWASLDDESGVVRARQVLPALTPGASGLVMEVRRDVSALDAAFNRNQHAALLLAAICLVVMCYIGLLVLDKTAIGPLQALTARLRGILKDRSQLGQTVTVGGNAEVVELEVVFNDMTRRLKDLYENLERLAFTDALTALPNRAVFHDRLQQMILTARRDQKSFALCIMDIDRFKDINDTLGHPVGDALLKQVAERLRSRLRDSDTVARLGGDEFAVLLPSVERQHAAMAARMLLQSLRVPFTLDDRSLDIGASVGIVLYPDHGADADILIQRADVAMYVAKHAGGGYAFYEAEHDRGASQRLALMAELRRAVEQEQFELHYQPKIDLATGRVMGVEALMRWRHPRDGLIMPDAFIPMLEQTGQIRALTPWMLSEALAFGRRLQAAGMSVTVSMNLSVRDLQDPNLDDTLAEQLSAVQADPSMCEFEVTESAVMTEPQRAIEALNRLAETGFRLAIDDFGTGYSSFAYLKKLPVNTLKIDKSFVIGMSHDDNDAAIVRASIELAHSLNLKIVAEGVEDAGTLERLRLLGCDAAQGHYISRPLIGDELLSWLSRSSWARGDETPSRISAG